jgi:hypothetical protein
MVLKGEITLEYDQETREYVAFWEPVIIGMGKTERDAVDDLTAAANLFLDTFQEKFNAPKEE